MTTLASTLTSRLQTLIGDTASVYADKYLDAINNAAREIYPVLFKRLLNETLITGNALPNSHFEDWSQTTYPDHWAVSSVTALEETTIIRGGAKSAKVTRAGTDGYLYCYDTSWQRLLDLMDITVSFKCWVLASTADQAYIEIYDGTDTETSTAHTGGGEWELLEIEDYDLPDDLTDIQFRLKVITSDGDAYFDNARVTGKNLYEYLLPLDFQNGTVSQVHLQSQGYSDDICDDLDLGANAYSELFGWKIIDDGTYKYLRTASKLTANRKLKLIGYCPLEDDLDADADTLSLEGGRLNLLLSYAAYLLYEMQRGVVSSDGIDRYDRECARWLGKVQMLKSRLRMRRPPSAINWSL